MKLKKVIAVIAVLAVMVGGAVFGISSYKSYQKKSLVASVQPVSDLNYGYWEDAETSYGIVTNDSSQEVYLDDAGKIQEVYVKKGDVVEEGTALLKYDTSEAEIDIQRKNLEIDTTANDLAKAQRVLATLKNTSPVDKTPPQQTTSNEIEQQILELERQMQELEAQQEYLTSLPQTDETDSRIYNYLTEDSVPYNEETADGTQENPYIYCCNKDVYADGSFYNSLRPQDGEDGIYVKFIICKKDDEGKMLLKKVSSGDIIEAAESINGTEVVETVVSEVHYEPVPDDGISPNTKEIDGNSMPMDFEEGRMWYIFSGEEVGADIEERLEELEAEIEEKLLEDEEDDWEEPEGYTQKELTEAINEKEDEVKKLDIQLRKQKLELESLQGSIEDGIVYAKLSGVVKSVGDLDKKWNEDDAFIVLTGDDGLYVSGTISELLLDEVKPGTVVTANSWESGKTFEATVTSVSDYPVSGNTWGEGNPNVSYYQYTAYMEDSSALKNGEYVDLEIEKSQSQEGGIYLDKAYVRQENGRYYVMIADETNHLKKQYVATGKIIYGGSAIEIKSGLSEEDKIAFPYGKTAVEGAAVTEDEDMNY